MGGDNRNRPFKVRRDGTQVGLVAKNFSELKKKGCIKLEISPKELEEVALNDDTVVDEEYFTALPPNTILHFKTKSDCDVKKLLDKTREVLTLSSSVKERDLQAFIKKGHYEEDSNVLSVVKYLGHLTGNPAEHRHEDEAWFEGLHSKYKTKCQVFRDRAQARVKSYYTLTREKLLPGDKNIGSPDDTDSTVDVVDRVKAKDVLENFKNRLKAENNQRELFDRSDTTNKCLCDKTGKFDCDGAYNKDACHAQHTINPYISRDAFVEFSSWNLDHQIEKSKEVIPRLKEAVSARNTGRRVNWQYFYNLLFTMENLRLVHVSCHDKTDHHLTVDQSKVFIN